MSRLFTNALLFLLLVIFVLLPVQTGAQELGLIVCDGPDCDFADLIKLVERLINAMVILSTFLAVAAFAYAGVKLLTSGGNESALKEARSIFTKVLIGYLWILAAWVVVYTITKVLLNPGYTLLADPK